MKALKHYEVSMKNDHAERITRLETNMSNLDQILSRLESKIDRINDRIDKVNERLWSNFLWLLSTMFLFSATLCGIMAKGFNWFG